MQGNILGQTGSNLKINGIIEEYKVASSGKVNAGDFVKYINTYGIDIGENTQISSADYSGNIGSAVQIDTNKVFIAYSSGSLVTLYGIICIIEEENITAGEATQLSTMAYSGNLPVVLQIDTNKVFIGHHSDDGANSTNYLYGIVCTIEGTTIGAGTDTKLTSINYSGTKASIVLLSTNKIFIAYGGDTGKTARARGTVCIIDGLNITKGADTQLSTIDYSASSSVAIKININKVFIAYGSNGSLYGVVCTIEGLNITVGTGVKLSTTSYYSATNKSVILVDKDKVFIAYGNSTINTSTNYLYGLVCTVEGTTITTGEDTKLSTVQYSGNGISAIQLNTNKVFITHRSDEYNTSSNNLYGIVCTIEGTTITKGTDTKLSTIEYSGNTKYVILLDKDKVFIIHSSGSSSASTNYLYGIVCTMNKTVITIGEDTQLNTIAYSGIRPLIVQLETNKALIVYSNTGAANSTNHLYGMVCILEENSIDLLKTSTDEIFGVSRTKGIGGQKVKIYIPKLAEYICTEDENRIISENGEEIRNE